MSQPSVAPAHPSRSEPSRPAADRSRARIGMVGKTTAAMLLVALLPIAILGGLTLWRQSARLGEAERAMQASAERISTQVDEWFDKSVRVLQAASNLPDVVSMRAEDQVKVLTALQHAYPWMYLVFTVGPDGKNLARSDGKPLVDYSDRQYYKDVIAGGKAVGWETLIGKTSHKPALVLALPIRSDGAVVGVLAAAMSIEDISRIIAHWKTGATGYAFVVDEASKVIAHPREEYVLSQTLLTEHPLVGAYRADGKPHLLAFSQTDGHPALGFVQPTRFGWAVAIQQDEEELRAPLRQTLFLGIGLLVGAAILVTIFARISSRMLIRPIVEMTLAADRMSLGELDTPITSTRHDELGLLAHSLERLRRSMRAAMARLR